MPWPTQREPAPAVAGTVAPKRVEPKDSTHRTVEPVHTNAERPEGRPAPKAATPSAGNRRHQCAGHIGPAE